MTRVQCGVALISHLFPDKSILKKSQSSFIHTDAVVMPNITQSVSFSGYLLRCLPHRYTHHSKFITLPLMLCYVNHNLILSKCNTNQAVSLRCYLLSGSQHTEVSEERTPTYRLYHYTDAVVMSNVRPSVLFSGCITTLMLLLSQISGHQFHFQAVSLH